MNFEPLYNRVVVKRATPKLVTAGGIQLTDQSAAVQTTEAEVLAVGPGTYIADGTWRRTQVRVGDTVIVLPGQGIPLKIEGRDVILLDEPNIIGILKKAGQDPDRWKVEKE